MKRKMRDYQTFIFDMDGTLIEGDTVLPGTLDLLHDLRNHKKQILLATNCPRWSKQSLAERLQQLGIAVFPHEIVTPVDALAAYFENEFSFSPSAGVNRTACSGRTAFLGVSPCRTREVAREAGFPRSIGNV